MNKIYLADIDPNHESITPTGIRRIRRTLMYHLLIWDSIVLSDSQLLLDPRINRMMRGFNIKDSLDSHDRGFEYLLSSGFVKVACREKNQSVLSFKQLYDEMASRGTDIPHFPQNDEYAYYIDSLNCQKIEYSIDQVAGEYQKNLISGVDSSFPTITREEKVLSEMFHEKGITFAHLLNKLDSFDLPKDGQEYKKIYNYLFGCYCLNIPKVTDSHFVTEYQFLPIHLGCGTGDFAENVTEKEFSTLKSTWVLNPMVLDLLSFEQFVELKQELQYYLEKHNASEKPMYFVNGTLPDLNEFIAFWDEYTHLFAHEVERLLLRDNISIYDKVLEISDVKLEQRTHLFGGEEVVESGISMVPIVGSIAGIKGFIEKALAFCRSLSLRPQWNDLMQRKQNLDSVLKPQDRIITKVALSSDSEDSEQTKDTHESSNS